MMDSEFSPGFLDTPSLMTPIITETPVIYRPSAFLTAQDVTTEPTTTTTTTTDLNAPLPLATSSNSSISNLPDESSSIASSGDKLSEIKNDLKQSVIQSRLPTESPFFSKTIVATSALGKKAMPVLGQMNNDLPTVIPSTAEIVCDIESLDKDPTKEATANIHSNPSETNLTYETSAADSMGMIVSPKKRLIMRSQSRTESTSPNPTVPSQSQKSSSEEDSFSEENPFQHAPETTFEAHPTVNRTSNVVFNGKRSIPNEVTSSDPTVGIKRQKINTENPMNFRMSMPVEPVRPAANEDERRQQIRDSNREAARRCRERRRNHIEELERTLDQHKAQIKQLTEKLIVSERENSQLKAIITEMKHFQPRRLPSNETIVEYTPMINATDGNLLQQRNFHSRAAH